VTNLHAALGGENVSRSFPEREGDVPLELPVNVLASYHFYRRSNMQEMASWGLRIIGDSGAYSAAVAGARIELEAYAEWVKRWESSLHWAASLDVIGDPEGTWRNWRALTALGVRTVPTLHYPHDPRGLDRLVEAGADFIGLGGMVPYKSEPQRLLRWSAAVMRYARDNHPHVRFHGWGVTHPQLLLNLPWWSVDSSGYASAYMYGRLILWDPEKARRITVPVGKEGRAVAAHARLLSNHYGLDDWRRIEVSNAATRRDLVRVSIRSLQLMEKFMTRRWGVTPPASLAHADRGPNVHAALGAPSMQPTRSLSPSDRPLSTHKDTP